ncbi:MAG: 3-oxoacyl-[acyl-carrier-protein] reductase [Chloroflexi bacterium]|nr:3-oxoacyl-[acyl-carrier-protein] reductase [Chloroflexota bacterium]
MSSGRVALVTGSSRGIGRAVALRLARDGASVIVNYRTSEVAAQAVVEEIGQLGSTAIAVAGDVTEPEAADRLVEAALDRFGRLDVLVANAGITRDMLTLRMSDGDWAAVVDTNLTSVFRCCRAALRPMLRQRSGRIVTISSVIGLAGNAGQANYAAAKAGVVGLTKSLAREFGSRSITVNAVAPGFIETELTGVLSEAIKQRAIEMIPLGHLGTPEDIAEAVAFLASPAARYITGHVLTVDGGMYMM